VDIAVVGSNGEHFAIDAIMAWYNVDEKKKLDHTWNGHPRKFRTKSKPHYSSPKYKCVVAIGSDEAEMKRKVKAANGTGGVEIVGLVVSVAHDSYTMYRKSPGAAAMQGPYYIPCDGVARSLDGSDVVSAQQFHSREGWKEDGDLLLCSPFLFLSSLFLRYSELS
jgi:hypothetical protein